MEKVIDKDELELVKKAIIDSGLYLASHEDLENMAKIILDEADNNEIELKMKKI